MRRPFCEVVSDELVRRRLCEAFHTLRNLPLRHHAQGYRLADGVGATDDASFRPAGRNRQLPAMADISRMDEALGWLVHLRSEGEPVRRAVQLRADGRSLRDAARQIGCSHVWVSRLEARGIAAIVAALRRLDLLPHHPSIQARLPGRAAGIRQQRLQ